MSKSDIYMSSFHIYVQIVIYMFKLQYIYPNCNICIQMVLYIYSKYKCCACPLSVLYITSYTSSHIYEQFDVCMYVHRGQTSEHAREIARDRIV